MAVTGWLAVTAVAFALVLAALDISGTGMLSSADQPLSEAGAAALLASLPSTTAPPAPPSGQPSAGTVVATAHGSVRLGCVGATPVVEYANPAPGSGYNMKMNPMPVPTIAILLGPTEIVAVCEHGQPVFYFDNS